MPPGPDANAIELFACVAAAGSFAQAARELGLTRAAVSSRIAAIEAAVGVPLFARTTRALGLTEAGRRLAQDARAVHEAAEAARRRLRSQARRGLGGTLRVTAVPMFGQTVLASLLARFQDLHPELRIELRLTSRRMDLLREDVDVAFRLTERPPEDWVAEPVLSYTVGAYAAPGAGPPLASPKELAARRTLLLGPPGSPQAATWRRIGSTRTLTTLLEPAQIADDLRTLVAVACAGGGVVFAPDFSVAAECAGGILVDVLPQWRLVIPQGERIVALTLPPPTAPESARALVRFVKEGLAGNRRGVRST